MIKDTTFMLVESDNTLLTLTFFYHFLLLTFTFHFNIKLRSNKGPLVSLWIMQLQLQASHTIPIHGKSMDQTAMSDFMALFDFKLET